MPGHVMDGTSDVRIFTGLSQDGSVPGSHLATMLAFRRAGDDPGPAAGRSARRL